MQSPDLEEHGPKLNLEFIFSSRIAVDPHSLKWLAACARSVSLAYLASWAITEGIEIGKRADETQTGGVADFGRTQN